MTLATDGGLAVNPSPVLIEQSAQAMDRRGVWGPTVAAVALSFVILGMVGFAPGMAHKAAHDLRHTVAFPCH